MSQTELNMKIIARIADKLRGLSDQELVAIYNDAIAWRAYRQQSIASIGQSAVMEVQAEEAKKAKEKEDKPKKSRKKKEPTETLTSNFDA